MSPNERLQSQPVLEISTSRHAQQNVSLALRPLAPKTAPRFRPLAIRGSSESLLLSSQRQGQQTGQSKARTPVRCPVCFKLHCPVISHKFHDEARRLRRSQTFFNTRTALSRDSLSVSYGVDLAALYDEPTPGPDTLGILQQLPIPDDLHQPLMCQLFHNWFVSEASTHFTVPHPLQGNSDLLHCPFLAPAFTDSVLCLSILTISAASRSQQSASPNSVLALTLCDRAMSKLRQRVNEHRDIVTDTTIAAATYLWAANIFLGDDATLQQHANSVRAIIEAQRYARDSGLSVAVKNLVKWVDIMNSLRLNQPSQYPDEQKHKLVHTIDRRSGSVWSTDEIQQVHTSDEAVLNACRQCCKLIDLINQTDPEEIGGATYFYLSERVAQLYQENSSLRTKYFGTGTVEECIALAVDILKLLVFNGGGQGASMLALKLQAKYLSTAIRAAGGAIFWRTRMQLFVWLVFLVHVCNPTDSHQEWSAFVLKGALEHVFGLRADWSASTMTRLEETLFAHGWSHTAPLADLKKLCDRLWT